MKKVKMVIQSILNIDVELCTDDVINEEPDSVEEVEIVTKE